MKLLVSLLAISCWAQQTGTGNIGVVITPSGGGGSTSPGGSDTQCQYNNANSFGGITGCTTNGTSVTLVTPALGTPTALVLTNATGLPAASVLPGTFGAGNYTVNGNLTVGTTFANFLSTALSTPTAPTLTKVGAGTGTTWGYKSVARSVVGATIASSEATISGNATLDGTHSITVDPGACAANQSGWDIYRTTSGGNPSDTGRIQFNLACAATLSDTGLVPNENYDGNNFIVDPLFPPINNTSKGQYLSGNLTVNGYTSIGNLSNQGEAGYQDQGWQLYNGPVFFSSANAWSGPIGGAGGASSGVIANSLYASVSDPGADANLGALQVVAEDISSNTSNLTILSGIFASAAHSSNTTVSETIGVFGNVNASGGTIATSRGVEALTILYNAGLGTPPTITSGYGHSAGIVQFSGTTLGTYDGYYSSTTLNGTVTGRVTDYRSTINAVNADRWSFYAEGTAASKLPSTTFGALVAYADAAEVYCSDCTVTSGSDNTCAASGTGAAANRINGAWKCEQ